MIPKSLSGRIVSKLGFRLMSAFGIALMPLALLSYNQARKFETESQARWESALFGRTLLAAAPTTDAINRARGVAAAAAIAIVPSLGDLDGCTQLFRTLVAAESNLSFAGYIPTDGNMTCASTGQAYNFAGDEDLRKARADPRPTMTVNRNGPISGESVLIFSHPVRLANGQLLGFVSLSMPHRSLENHSSETEDRADGALAPLALVTFDSEGTVLTAIYGIDSVASHLPVGRNLADFVGDEPETFRSDVISGEDRTFVVIPTVPGTLYVLGSWPAAINANLSFVGFLPLWLFPLAMWFASMLVAYLAAENQVLRHVRTLRQSIIAFAGGSRFVNPPDLSAAPNELREVGQAYERLMISVLRDEAAMEDTLRQKDVLLREVHHRVKNNLQLIASIMSLQIRKSMNPEARSLLRGLHERVMSLATVHRELYQTSGLVDVRADELLDSIVSQVLRMGARSDLFVETKTDFDDIRLTPDQAVPLSLILTEALTNALKHANLSAPGKLDLSVTLRRSTPDHAQLEVRNSIGTAAQPEAASRLQSSGLGQQLLAAFAIQLRGTLTVGPKGSDYVVKLDFPLQWPTSASVSDDSPPKIP